MYGASSQNTAALKITQCVDVLDVRATEARPNFLNTISPLPKLSYPLTSIKTSSLNRSVQSQPSDQTAKSIKHNLPHYHFDTSLSIYIPNP